MARYRSPHKRRVEPWAKKRRLIPKRETLQIHTCEMDELALGADPEDLRVHFREARRQGDYVSLGSRRLPQSCNFRSPQGAPAQRFRQALCHEEQRYGWKCVHRRPVLLPPKYEHSMDMKDRNAIQPQKCLRRRARIGPTQSDH